MERDHSDYLGIVAPAPSVTQARERRSSYKFMGGVKKKWVRLSVIVKKETPFGRVATRMGRNNSLESQGAEGAVFEGKPELQGGSGGSARPPRH